MGIVFNASNKVTRGVREIHCYLTLWCFWIGKNCRGLAWQMESLLVRHVEWRLCTGLIGLCLAVAFRSGVTRRLPFLFMTQGLTYGFIAGVFSRNEMGFAVTWLNRF